MTDGVGGVRYGRGVPMVDDPDEIAAALRGTVPDGLPIEECLGETCVITGIEPGQLLPGCAAERLRYR